MSAVKDSGVGYLDEGDVLTFEIEEGKSPSAVNLRRNSSLLKLVKEAQPWEYIMIINQNVVKEYA